MKRKEFIEKSIKSSLALTLAPSLLANIKKSSKSLKILILGGTSFLGPAQVAYALERGHEVSIFTRGKTKPTTNQEYFKRVEHIIGDRDKNLDSLKNRKWDVVIDNSGRNVKWTTESATLLKENVDLYIYTSSTGVFYPYLGNLIGEETKLLEKVPSDATGYTKMEYDYGVMKTLSENAVKKIFGEKRALLVRPTYMMGPGDRTDRFTYWPQRLSIGGKVLVPGKAIDPVQYVDVRDVGEFMIRLAEMKMSGTFNTGGPNSVTGMHQFIYGAHAAFNSQVDFVFATNHEFLEKMKIHDAVPWIMPKNNNYGSARIDFRKAKKNGLVYRPLAESVKDIHQWWNSGKISKERQDKLLNGKAALMTKEKMLIQAWDSFK